MEIRFRRYFPIFELYMKRMEVVHKSAVQTFKSQTKETKISSKVFYD